jgi:hypothetical protein
MDVSSEPLGAVAGDLESPFAIILDLIFDGIQCQYFTITQKFHSLHKYFVAVALASKLLLDPVNTYKAKLLGVFHCNNT